MSIKGKQAMITTLKVFNTIGLAVLIALVFVVLARIAASQKQARSDTNASTTRIENDLNCLGRFFNQQNRQNLVINDLNSCTITNTQTGSSKVLVGPPAGKATTTTSTPAKRSTAQPVVSQTSPQTTDTAPTTTTSAPPDPSFLQQVTSTVTGLPQDVTTALGGL